ncbi:lysophospholipid acyltransferase family protein [Jongsikchunia kroppenstedtii]|uniref:lysophospholipid acyltransferase family protein n=1 Tax=Jongsikchunia kroppenstedtii TaxID=1121721 RepID=UPI0003A95719|nr:lysophospholipid acyltransferase family protein [Jongsikchunia kroppenstedtii]
MSACGDGCIAPQARVSAIARCGRVVRLVATAGWLLALAVMVAPLPGVVRRRFARRAAARLLAALGVRIEVVDERPFAGRGVGLVVANHVSFLDIAAIAAVVPARFVAKAEVVESAATGFLCRRFGIIPLRRQSLRDLPATVHAVTGRLQLHESVAVFPEGTTFCGAPGVDRGGHVHRGAGRFHPAFFEAATIAAVPVLPITVSYHHRDGSAAAEAGFIGDDGLGDTLRRVLAAPSITVRVRIHELELPAGDRRELADRCERVVLGVDRRGPINASPVPDEVATLSRSS